MNSTVRHRHSHYFLSYQVTYENLRNHYTIINRNLDVFESFFQEKISGASYSNRYKYLLLKQLYMRRRTFLTLGNEGIKASEAMAGDICLYNKRTDKLLIVSNNVFNDKNYPSSNYSPVGVVIIPGNHNVYGDGSCAVMSLKYMSCDTPDNGSTNDYNIVWGYNKLNISNLNNYNQICYVGTEGVINKTVIGKKTENTCLPSDIFTTVQNPYDKDTWYYFNESGLYYAPSPYNDDDTRNPAYYQTSSPSSTENALSDFDGVGNTEILCSLATTQSDWETASSITNDSGIGYYPSACCCWRYHTEGTKQGDWYLPACGELGYIIPKMRKLMQTIETLITSYGSTVVAWFEDTNYYWSSTQYDTNRANNLNPTNGGNGGWYYKNYYCCVRAFLRVK